jgi:hypothetical protein
MRVAMTSWIIAFLQQPLPSGNNSQGYFCNLVERRALVHEDVIKLCPHRTGLD